MKTVLLTGSQGFIGAFLCAELLANNYVVYGVDNYSKYGPVARPHDEHTNFSLIEGDVEDISDLIADQLEIDYVIAGAAMIGGIALFSEYPYDLLADNERIIASTFDFAIARKHQLKRIVVISSSMVFESVNTFPTKESDLFTCPPPVSTYGWQKLSTEKFALGAWLQYGLPYTIIRPFNAVGVGEGEALYGSKVEMGNTKMMMSHVLPDIIHRAMALGRDDLLPILGTGDQLRCYTNGVDIARGIRLAMESDEAVNNDFNISTPQAHTVKELATIVWNQIHGCDPKFTHMTPYKWDVQTRIPDVTKARDILGFEATVPIEQSVSEVIAWMKGSRNEP